MRRITVVCQPYYPDGTSTSQLFTGLFEELARQGFSITVLCGFPSSEKGVIGKVPRIDVRNGVNIYRCGARIDLKRNNFARVISYFCFLSHLLVLLLTRPRPDILFAVTNPPFNAQVLWLVSLLRGLDYQYMFLDLMPEAFIALHYIRPRSLIARIWRTVNGWAYRRARTLVVLGRDTIPLLVRTYQVDPSGCVYIPHWSPFSSKTAKPFSESTLSRRLGLTEKFVVQYSGNMGILHDLDIFVLAAERLQNDSRIHFLFIGGGQRRRNAEQLCQQKGLRNVTWHNFVPLEELDDSLACCHAALISLRSGMEGVAVPCKLYGILASGRCVIAQVPAKSEIALTVEESKCGVVVAPDDLESLVSVIRDAADHVDRVVEEGRRARQAYEDKYQLQQGVDAFRQLWGG